MLVLSFAQVADRLNRVMCNVRGDPRHRCVLAVGHVSDRSIEMHITNPTGGMHALPCPTPRWGEGRPPFDRSCACYLIIHRLIGSSLSRYVRLALHEPHDLTWMRSSMPIHDRVVRPYASMPNYRRAAWWVLNGSIQDQDRLQQLLPSSDLGIGHAADWQQLLWGRIYGPPLSIGSVLWSIGYGSLVLGCPSKWSLSVTEPSSADDIFSLPWGLVRRSTSKGTKGVPL
jgi:hypothetical protein